MKKLTSLVLALILLATPIALFIGCSGSAGDSGTGDSGTGDSGKQTLVVCNWGEYISSGEDDSLDVIAEFEERFNCEVEYVTAETNETLYSLMQSGSVTYDVIFPSDYMVERMIKEDMLAEINYDNIPNYANILPEFKGMAYDPEEKYSVPYFWGTVGIIYNEKLLTPEDLKTVQNAKDFEILWSKNYRNRIMMINNPRDAFGIALKTLGYSQNTTDEAQIREAAAKLKEQKFLYYMDEFFYSMPNDALALGVYYAGDYLFVAEENENLKFVIPECGTNVFSDAMCIPKNARNKDLAEKFINFMLEPEIGLANAEYVNYSSPNSAVLEIMDEDMKNNPIAYPVRKDNWEAFRDLPDNVNTLMRDLWAEILTENK